MFRLKINSILKFKNYVMFSSTKSKFLSSQDPSNFIKDDTARDGKEQFQLALNYFYNDESTEDLNKAFELLTKSVENNCKESKIYLGQCYNFGLGVEKDLKKAFYWYEEASKDGDVNALIKLGFLYRDSSMEINFEKSFQYFLQSAEKGSPEGMYLVGLGYLNAEGTQFDLKKGLEYFEKSSELDYDPATTFLGECYLKGEIVEKDFSKGFNYYLKSAESESIPSILQVGWMYFTGTGVEKNIEKAEEYFQIVAQKDDNDAQFMLGNLLLKLENHSIEHYKRGIEIMKKLAQLEHLPAEKALSMIYYQSTGSDREKCIPLFEKLANKGQKESAYFYALCLMKGDMIKQDEKLAFGIFSELSDLGDSSSMLHLGVCYLFGQGTKTDVKQAIEWLTKAHKAGDKTSGHMLGVMYTNGSPTPQSDELGFKYFLESADLGNVESIYCVGKAYIRGKGVNLDFEKGFDYLTRASDLGHVEAKNLLIKIEQFLKEESENLNQ